MMDRETILELLRASKPTMVARFAVREVGLYMPLAPGEGAPESSVYLLVEFDDDVTLDQINGLADYLRERFGGWMHLTLRQWLAPEYEDDVLSGLIPVWAVGADAVEAGEWLADEQV